MKTYLWMFGSALSAALAVAACTAEDRQYQSQTGAGGAGGEAVSAGGAGGQGSGQGGQGGAPIVEACAVFAQNVCDRYVQCAPGDITRVYGDDVTCRDRYLLYCTAILSAPGTAWTPGAIVDCSNAYLGLDCNLFVAQPFRALDDLTPPSCLPPPGALPDGAPCLDSGQCQSTNCHHAIGAFCGVCGPKAQVGQPCSTNFDCEAHNVCFQGACSPAGEPGMGCMPPADHCNIPWDCFGGMCVKPGFTGDVCNGNGPACAFFSGYYCEPSTSQCQPIEYASPGSPCGQMMGTAFDCIGSGRCLNGICLDRAKEGEACDPMNGAYCMPPAFCVNGSCALPDGALCQ